MKLYNGLYKMKRLSLFTAAFVLALLAAILSFTSDRKENAVTYSKKDSLASQQAFLQVYKVLMSPRCMNCHPSGDIPLQGDDSHLHTQGVKRGPDGKGLYALKCSNCHQAQNTPGLNMPPGNPTWHLPPADMKMVFQGKTPRQLAMQLKDPNQNGHKTLNELIKHVSSDSLVLWGWRPGDGRTKPPLDHATFARMFREWVQKGAVVPE